MSAVCCRVRIAPVESDDQVHNIPVVKQQQMNNVLDGLLVELAVQPEVVQMAADRQLEELPEVRHAVALTTISD